MKAREIPSSITVRFGLVCCDKKKVFLSSTKTPKLEEGKDYLK